VLESNYYARHSFALLGEYSVGIVWHSHAMTRPFTQMYMYNYVMYTVYMYVLCTLYIVGL